MMDESSNKNKNEKATDTFREVEIFRIDISYNEITVKQSKTQIIRMKWLPILSVKSRSSVLISPTMRTQRIPKELMRAYVEKGLCDARRQTRGCTCWIYTSRS